MGRRKKTIDSFAEADSMTEAIVLIAAGLACHESGHPEQFDEILRKWMPGEVSKMHQAAAKELYNRQQVSENKYIPDYQI